MQFFETLQLYYFDIKKITEKVKKLRWEKIILDGYNNMVFDYEEFKKLALNERGEYPDLFELDGIRIGITDIDIKVVII